MAKNRPTVLFLTPGASSVGGNIFLLNFLRWFKRNSDIPFVTVYGHGGDLTEAFAELGPAYNFGYEWDDLGPIAKNRQRVEKYFRLRERSVLKKLAGYNIGLIYSNAVINHQILAALPKTDVPLIAHCHELESLIHKHGLDNFELLKQRAHMFVAVAEAVRDNLVRNHQIENARIETVHEFIPLQDISDEDVKDRGKKVRRELGIPEDAFLVGASGTMYWRKAPDLFIQIAAEIKRKHPDKRIHFLWIGGARQGDPALYEARYDVEKLGMADKIHFVEHLADPTNHFGALDVFALTSREDPFPLVCLEAASMGKPIICFADAGGMPEFVRDDCGFVVPYIDVEMFATRIVDLYDDREMSAKMGKAAQARVFADHDIETAAPKMLRIIEKYIRP